MNLEDLKKRINKPTAFEWRGETVWLRKLGAQDGMTLVASIKNLSSQSLDTAEDQEKTLDFHARTISKSLSDEAGVLQLDSDDGIATLKQVNFAELVELGELVLKHSGFGGEAKKNSVTNNFPPTDSALELDSGPTQITSSLT